MIRKEYLGKEVGKSMKNEFRKGMLRLDSFLEEKEYNKIFDILKKLDSTKIYEPDRFVFSELNFSDEFGFFSSDKFIDFISSILGRAIKIKDLKVRKYDHRKYEVRHDSKNKNDFEFFLFFSNTWDLAWGGNVVYVSGDESFVFDVVGNSFVLINSKDKDRFVQYVNHFSNKNEFYLVSGAIVDVPPTINQS